MLYSLKYHVPSQGIVGKNQIWRIYNGINEGFTNTTYVEHIEIEEGIDSWTGNGLFRVGYSLILEADEVEIFIDEESGLKHARFYNKEK